MGDRVEVNTGRRIVMVQSVSEDLDCVDEVERLLRGLMAPTAHEIISVVPFASSNLIFLVLLRFPTTSVRLFESVAELRTPPFEVQYAIERYKIEYLGLAGNGGVSLQELDKLVVAKMMDSQVKDMGLCNFANPADDPTIFGERDIDAAADVEGKLKVIDVRWLNADLEASRLSEVELKKQLWDAKRKRTNMP